MSQNLPHHHHLHHHHHHHINHQHHPPQPCPPGGMTLDEYRTRAKDMVDYIANYLSTIRDRRVFPDVSPGYMSKLIPNACPEQPEAWDDIFADVERVIMPGMTHWQSPYNHAYYPALNCYPSLLGDMLADAINCIGFTWASSPACTELETIVMDWLGKMIGLPAPFLHGNHTHKSLGGGCIQTTASDCTFVTLLAARADAIRRFKVTSPETDDAEINGRLIGYCSDQAHSSVEKAGLIGLVKLRYLPADDNLSLRGDTLQEAVYRDREMGLIPFYVCATLGTTGACAFDNLTEVGPVCQSENLWLHIDAAYAGSAFICPEYRNLMAGVEHANSFAMNPSKWLMVHFDCSAMWVKDATTLHRTFNVEPLYLQHENSGAAIDYMHWQIALSRRFRSLKLWFVLRSYGVEGFKAHVRRGVERAIHFEKLVRSDRRFEVSARRYLGLVVFRIVGPNQLTEALLKRLNKQGKIHMVPASLKGKYVIRFTVTSQYTTVEDIERDWKIITEMATKILSDTRNTAGEVIQEKEEEEEDDEEEEQGEEEEGVLDAGRKNNLALKIKNSNADDESEKITKRRLKGDAVPRVNGHIGKNENTEEAAAENGSKDAVEANFDRQTAIANEDDNDDDDDDDDYDHDNDERNRKMKTTKKKKKKQNSSITRKNTDSLYGRSAETIIKPEDLGANNGKEESVVIKPQNTSSTEIADRKTASTNIKFLTQKSAAAKRRDYGSSLLLSHVVPMSPKIVNGSFAALFDGDGSSNYLDLSQLTRKLGMDGEFIRLSPRKRGMLGDSEKQLSLDYGVLSASQKSCPVKMSMMGSLDSKIDDILELTTTLKEEHYSNRKEGLSAYEGGGMEDGMISEVEEEEEEAENYVSGNFEDERKDFGKGVGFDAKRGGKNSFGEGGEEEGLEVGEDGMVLYYDVTDGRVEEKENWDTGHGDVANTFARVERDRKPQRPTCVSGTSADKYAKAKDGSAEKGRGQGQICPLCGRGGV